MSFLSVNLGNSRVSLALFQNGKMETKSAFSVSQDWEQSLQPFLRALSFAEVGLCSVNPPLEDKLLEQLRRHQPKRLSRIGHDLSPGIAIKIRKPETVGLDRLVSARAAWERFRRACIVLDFGTAVTVNVVNEKGEFLGGAIAPGFALCAQALNQGTAQLPKTEVRIPYSILGQETAEAIWAGIYFGMVGAVQEWVKRAKEEIGPNAVVVATGGDHEKLLSVREIEHFLPDLVHEGIYRICQS